MYIWDIEDFIGTLYTNIDCDLGHLLQTIYWLDNQGYKDFFNLIPWEYHNIAEIIKNDTHRWRDYYDLNVSPTVNPIEHYCSILTSTSYENQSQMAWSFMHIFDLVLHDTAVTMTYKAAKESSEVYAEIACNLWQYSRQLRVDANRPACQAHITNVLFPGMKQS